MFERLKTPEDVFTFKLGSALSMEDDTLKMLGDLEEHAQRDELKQIFREHAEETRQQAMNIRRCFEVLGLEVSNSASPTTKGLAAEGKSTIRKADDAVVDSVILAGALETEHYEIAVYETLIAQAEAKGAHEVVNLLKTNLQQEETARDKVKAAAQQVAEQSVP